jgi:flagellar protein FlaJ
MKLNLNLDVKKMEKKYLSLLIGAPVLVTLLLLLFFFHVPSTTILFLASIGVLGIATPYFAFGYLEFVDIKKAEEAYPNFLRDLTQAVNSGMTIPQAIETASGTDYGALTKYVGKLNAWLKWSVPFPKAWQNFTNLLKKSEVVQRINGIILESFDAGGDIGAILLALSEDVDTIKKMEADKRSTMLQHLGVMYVVFLVFIGIIVTLHKILLPILFLQRFGVFSGISFRPAEVLDAAYFKNLFLLMTIVQGVCLGIMAGQITEERLIAGFKHVLIMTSIGVAVFFLFILPTQLTFDVEVVPQSLGIGQTYTVRGTIFFDEQPAGGAIVEIVAPEAFLTLTANSLGEFNTNLIAPTQSGPYQVSVQMTFEQETQTITKIIVVE